MKVYGDQDADISYISKKVVAILGYGNQGRAQALNLRDSGVSVVVGNIEDSYAQTARSDGFEVYFPAEAAQRGDILALLVPDEVQAEIYATSIAPHIRPRQVLDFAAGYNIHFGLIRPPADVDVIMVAPRMIGVNVRRAFETGGGVPAFVDVWQNASGQGMEIALAFAKGIGATRAGVLPVSFRDEVEIDLFTEQALWPAIVNALVTSYELLVEKGYAPEAVLMELWGTGEAAEIMTEMARTGLPLWSQAVGGVSGAPSAKHSPTRVCVSPFATLISRALARRLNLCARTERRPSPFASTSPGRSRSTMS